jgi:hypothetical protein
MALKDILKKMVQDTANAQAKIKAQPSPTQQIMSNIKQTIAAPPQPSIVGRAVDQVRQIQQQPVQAPVKPIQYPNTQIRQQTDQESAAGTQRYQQQQSQTKEILKNSPLYKFFTPMSRGNAEQNLADIMKVPISLPFNLAEQAVAIGVEKLNTPAKALGLPLYSESTQKTLLNKSSSIGMPTKTPAGVLPSLLHSVVSKSPDLGGQELVSQNPEVVAAAELIAPFLFDITKGAMGLVKGATPGLVKSILYKSKLVPSSELKLGFQELTSGVKSGATPEALGAAQELINLNSKGSELFNALKTGADFKVKRDFVGWFKDLFGYKAARSPEMNAFVAELSGKDLTKFTSKQVDNYFNKGMSLFKENRPVGFKGLEGGAARPGIEYAAPLPEKYIDEGLSTKILSQLEGRTTVSKQFIEDLTNQGSIKQVEKDMIRNLVKDYKGDVPVADFANKVKAELLPLTLKSPETHNTRSPGNGLYRADNSRYEAVTLPVGIRGDVVNYAENIYESPIPTNAGSIHFPGDTKNYYGHTRIEDMSGSSTPGLLMHSGPNQGLRRVIEVQSDLYQKGNLNAQKDNYRIVKTNSGSWAVFDKNNDLIGSFKGNTEIEAKKFVEDQVAKLQQYNDPTAHFRMAREEIKSATADGKTRIQFPTGETAMKIEGLVSRDDKWVTLDNKVVNGANIKNGDLITYQTYEGVPHEDRRFFITKNNGDGTFEAADSLTAENDSVFYALIKKKGLLDDGRMPSLEELKPHIDKEIIDYLGKISEQLSAKDTVDKNSPIYKFYEKDLGKYLKNNYGASLVTDPQGVSWYEIPLSKLPKDVLKTTNFAFLGGDKKLTPQELYERDALAEVKMEIDRDKANIARTSDDPESTAIRFVDNLINIFNEKGNKFFLVGNKTYKGNVMNRFISVKGSATFNDTFRKMFMSGDMDTFQRNLQVLGTQYKDKPFGQKLLSAHSMFGTGLLDNPDLYGEIIEPRFEKYLSGDSGGKDAGVSNKVSKGDGGQRPSNSKIPVQGGKTSSFENGNSLLSDGKVKPKAASFEEFLDQHQENIPLPEPPPELGQTLETEARQLHSSLPPKFVGEVSSFDKIVNQMPTSVQNKINVLDYFRTPDKVLEKIGFGEQAKMLRKGYDAYVKELPKNLDKITEWSKRVPASSNERIFDYLDGHDVKLDTTELQVATEVQSWLKDWARRLGLPADKQITHYITHIFEDELMSKEFDEDLAKIIANKLPGQVYDPFLLERLGAKGYIHDTWAALDAYAKRGTRKVNMDPALESIRKKAGSELETSNVEESVWKFLQRYINQVNMRPTEMDKLIDNTIKSIFGNKVGARPVLRFTGILRRTTSRGLLGLNLSSALRNLSQGANIYATLGGRYTVTGYAKLFNLKSHQELFDEGVLDSGFIQDRVLSSTKKAVQNMDKVLYSFMSLGERINRGAAYFGAKSKYINEHTPQVKTDVSLTKLESDAKEYAKGIVRKTQFSFGTIDQPVAIGGDIVKTFAQLQNYTLKQTEFLVGMMKDKNYAGLLRYAFAGLLFVYTVGEAFNMKPRELIPSFRFDFPPAFTVPVETIKAILNTPDKYGKPRDMEQKVSDISKALYGLIPASSQLKKTAGAISALIDDGQIINSSGKVTFAIDTNSTVDVVKALLFGVFNSEGGQQYLNKMKNGSSLETIQPSYDKIQKLREQGKSDEAIAAYDALSVNDKKLYQMLKVSPTYHAIQKLKDEKKVAEGIALYDKLTAKEKKAYQDLKTEEAKAKADLTSEPIAEDYVKGRGNLGLMWDYTKAFATDPSNAWKAFTTKEQLGIVKGNLVEMQRFYGINFKEVGGSEEYKKKLMKKQGIPEADSKKWFLEHITPVKAGGDSSDSNLYLSTKEDHDSYTPIEVLAINAMYASKITRKEVTKLMKAVKIDKTMTTEEARKSIENNNQ